MGDQVQADFDGDWYTGKVTKVKGTKATVSFEDGEVHELEFSELQPFSPTATTKRELAKSQRRHRG